MQIIDNGNCKWHFIAIITALLPTASGVFPGRLPGFLVKPHPIGCDLGVLIPQPEDYMPSEFWNRFNNSFKYT